MTHSMTTMKHKNKVASWELEHHMEKTEDSLSLFRMERPRWFEYAADHVTKVYKVKCWTVDPRFARLEGSQSYDHFYELETARGRALVIQYQSGSEIVGWIGNDGTILHAGGWRKRGNLVGGACSWFRAQKINPSGKKVDNTCPARMYATVAGKTY